MVAAAGVLLNQISISCPAAGLHCLIGLLAVGVGGLSSSLHVFLRDTAQVIAWCCFWFWLTPIFISEEQFPERTAFFALREPFLLPGARLSDRCCWPDRCRVSRISALLRLYGAVVFVIGGLFFRHMKRGFADVL